MAVAVKKKYYCYYKPQYLPSSFIQIIKNTWEKAAYNMLIASDFDDPGNGTANLPMGDLNLCHRNLAIIKYFSMNCFQNDWRWLVIADDDTMLGVAKMMDLLQCYDMHHDEYLAIGERYGFHVTGPKAYGYNFISGGGGIILNRKLALKLNQACSCPNTDAMDRMDDVQLGACIHKIEVPIIHSERLHQVRGDEVVIVVCELSIRV